MIQGGKTVDEKHNELKHSQKWNIQEKLKVDKTDGFRTNEAENEAEKAATGIEYGEGRNRRTSQESLS